MKRNTTRKKGDYSISERPFTKQLTLAQFTANHKTMTPKQAEKFFSCDMPENSKIVHAYMHTWLVQLTDGTFYTIIYDNEYKSKTKAPLIKCLYEFHIENN